MCSCCHETGEDGLCKQADDMPQKIEKERQSDPWSSFNVLILLRQLLLTRKAIFNPSEKTKHHLEPVLTRSITF